MVHRGARGVHRHPPVYESMEVELRKMLGKKLYRRVAEYLDGRRRDDPAAGDCTRPRCR